jgi:hypothetical protein
VAESRGARDPGSTSTAPEELPLSRIRRARSGRRLFFALLTLFLFLAFTGVLGVRTGEATGSGGGYEVTVTHPSVTRPGLAANLSIELRREGGLPGVVTLAMSSSYLDNFDENGLDPDPVQATTDQERVIWTFDPPPAGETITISFDTRVEPSVQFKRAKGKVEVLENGQAVATVNFRTLMLP